MPAALLMLSAVPLLAGALRLVELVGGPELMPADHRFEGFPLPLVAHIAGATTYAVVGAFQFVPRLRRRHLGWHRRAGRVLAAAGLIVAGSALCMTLFYAPQPGIGPLLYLLRLLFGCAMVACLILGVTTVRRGESPGTAPGYPRVRLLLAAGTQAFTGGIGGALFGAARCRRPRQGSRVGDQPRRRRSR